MMEAVSMSAIQSISTRLYGITSQKTAIIIYRLYSTKLILVIFSLSQNYHGEMLIIYISQKSYFQSSYGTYVNSERLKKDKSTTIRDGDEVAFGPGSSFKYIFYTEDTSSNPLKKKRLDGHV
jgi:hypothetical protein